MKLVKLMVVTLALTLVAASASYAAVSFTSASTLNMMAPNARNGLAGNVALTAVSTGTIPVGETLINSYGGAQISVLSTICVKATILTGTVLGFGSTAACTAAGVVAPGTIVSGAGFPAYGTAITLAGVMSVTVNQTNITVNFLTGVPFTVTVDGFEYSGVRLNVVPLTGGTSLNTTINSTITSILSQVSTTNPYLPVAVTQDPLNLLPVAATAKFSSGAIALTPTVNLTAVEGPAMPNAFATNGAAALATKVIFQIASIPAGITATGAVIAAAPVGYTLAGSTAGSMANGVVVGVTALPVPVVVQAAGATTATVTVSIPASDPTIVEVVPITVTFACAATTLPVGAIATATATLGPEITGAAALTTLVPPTIPLAFGTLGPVYYQAQWEPTVNVLEIQQLTTELLSQFNYYSGADGYNTGISIFNATGFNGAVGQTAEITVTLYPFAPPTTPIAAKITSATFKPGFGLDANGKLPAGGSWIVLLNDILSGMGVSGSFQGAIRFTCFFTHGHGSVWDCRFKICSSIARLPDVGIA